LNSQLIGFIGKIWKSTNGGNIWTDISPDLTDKYTNSSSWTRECIFTGELEL